MALTPFHRKYCDTCMQKTWHDDEDDCWGPRVKLPVGGMFFGAEFEDVLPDDELLIFGDYHNCKGRFYSPDEFAQAHDEDTWSAMEDDSDGFFIVRQNAFVIREAIHLEGASC